MTKFAHPALLAALLSLTLASSSAQTLSGTVTNGTTGKPGAGDEVILINLTTSMEIAANTKADSNGKFHLQHHRRSSATSHPRRPSGGHLPSDGASRREFSGRQGL